MVILVWLCCLLHLQLCSCRIVTWGRQLICVLLLWPHYLTYSPLGGVTPRHCYPQDMWQPSCMSPCSQLPFVSTSASSGSVSPLIPRDDELNEEDHFGGYKYHTTMSGRWSPWKISLPRSTVIFAGGEECWWAPSSGPSYPEEMEFFFFLLKSHCRLCPHNKK